MWATVSVSLLSLLNTTIILKDFFVYNVEEKKETPEEGNKT